MSEVRSLVVAVEKARAGILSAAASLSEEQASFSPGDAWSVSQILEHLYLAELSGITKIWAAAEAFSSGERWNDERPNRGKSIEQVVTETWKPKEVAPPIATPHIGGPLGFWLAAFPTLTSVLAELGARLEGQPLDEVIFPHFLSGPLDARQRLEFLRFHIERHAAQLERVREDPSFPR